MITTKQRAKLRGMANSIDVLVHIGKEGFTENVISKLEDELFAHELVKCAVLQSCNMTAKEAVRFASEKTGCEIVQAIGKKFVVYKPNPEEPVIQI